MALLPTAAFSLWFVCCISFNAPVTARSAVDDNNNNNNRLNHPTPAAPGGCFWEGKAYADGERFEPDGCTSCQCQHGSATCAPAPCRPPPCVDSVPHPDQCCPVCPNGGNCRAPDGTVIPEGQKVVVRGSSECYCDDTGTGFFQAKEAVCSLVGPLPPDGQ